MEHNTRTESLILYAWKSVTVLSEFLRTVILRNEVYQIGFQETPFV